jgi:3-oxosteroid 1-dehydrogenase
MNNFDVVVVGSGAGAMLAAIRAHDKGQSVLVIEKSQYYGGTSAISGGGIWIPNNHYFKRKGGQDSVDLVRTYLYAAIGDQVDPARVEAYIQKSPEMAMYLETDTRVKYEVAERYPDYYQHLPGSLAGGRSLDPELFDVDCLGDEIHHLQPASPTTLLMGKIAWNARQAHKVMSKERGWRMMVLWAMLRYKFDSGWRKKRGLKRDRRSALGSSLVGALRRSMMDRNIPLWLNTDFKDFIVGDDGSIKGVIANRDGQDITINAQKGVILGAGGFERNQELREKYLPQPTNQAWSATPINNNTGAGLLASQKLGFDTHLLNWAWWCPTIFVPKEEKQRGVFAERAFPGAIVVNGRGERFIDEAAPYLEFGHEMYKNHQETGACIPAWVIFDGHYRFHYAMGPIMPAQIMPDMRVKKEWWDTVLWKADTLDELAKKINVDAAGLAATVEKMNRYAKTGIDEDFQRGGNPFDTYYGDSNVKPNPCLAPIKKAPYYAMKLDPGDIGTKGGILTNEFAQVLKDGQPVKGLYAIGNTSSSVMGTTYPGAGSTLGPAMTFGMIAADHLSSQ